MVWCKTTSAMTVGGSPQQMLWVSFTNADRSEVPVGMGWWDVIPKQVTADRSPVDASTFTTC